VVNVDAVMTLLHEAGLQGLEKYEVNHIRAPYNQRKEQHCVQRRSRFLHYTTCWLMYGVLMVMVG
jgi:hypothetical protein